MMSMWDFRIGTAGWAIPRSAADSFPTAGSGITRYASRFNAAEINSTFHRSHRSSTYERWSASVPDSFRFSVKAPKVITHQLRLIDAKPALDQFLDEISALGHRLGPILLQLPPSLAFDLQVARDFLAALRSRYAGLCACEPRHPTWFGHEANTLLQDYLVARVAADPARVEGSSEPGGWRGFSYFRLHGSPRPYYSLYTQSYITTLRSRLASQQVETWCIFDNTASGAACTNALQLLEPASV